MNELSNETKEQIAREEQFRVEVRKTLDSTPSKTELTGAMGFLNSGFGLWLLSALFITGCGSLYTQWQNHYQEQQKQQEQQRIANQQEQELVQKLRTELAHRLSQTLIRLYEVADRQHDDRLSSGHTADDVKAILDDFANGTGTKLAPLYPEFVTQTSLGLVTELHRHSSPGTDDGLSDVVADLSGLYVLAEVEKASLSNPRSVAGALIRRLDRLKFDTNFYFIDCPQKNPFC